MLYKKPYKTIPEQLALLKRRGMQVHSDDQAQSFLRHVGYYHLSAYWYPFRQIDAHQSSAHSRTDIIVKDEFKPGTAFQTIIDLYAFDRTLRLLSLDAIERIEIALRTEVALIMGVKDAYAYLDPRWLDGKFTKKRNKDDMTRYDIWLEKYQRSFKGSREEFTAHFKSKYPDEPLPIWIAIELWDFGMLSNFIDGMVYDDQAALCDVLGIESPDLLVNWMRLLNFIRNVSAHHARLWNRNMSEYPKFPKATSGPFTHILNDHAATSRFYSAALIMQFMLKKVAPDTQWPRALSDLVDGFPEGNGISIAHAGFPQNWRDQNIWFGV